MREAKQKTGPGIMIMSIASGILGAVAPDIIPEQLSLILFWLGIMGLVFGFVVWQGWIFLSSPTTKDKSQSERIVNPDDKLTTTINAINTAKMITISGQDVRVFITDANGLKQFYPAELQSVLLKLQAEKVLMLKSFPDWLLNEGKLTHERANQAILATIEPSRNNFIVSLLPGYKRYDKR